MEFWGVGVLSLLPPMDGTVVPRGVFSATPPPPFLFSPLFSFCPVTSSFPKKGGPFRGIQRAISLLVFGTCPPKPSPPPLLSRQTINSHPHLPPQWSPGFPPSFPNLPPGFFSLPIFLPTASTGNLFHPLTTPPCFHLLFPPPRKSPGLPPKPFSHAWSLFCRCSSLQKTHVPTFAPPTPAFFSAVLPVCHFFPCLGPFPAWHPFLVLLPLPLSAS